MKNQGHIPRRNDPQGMRARILDVAAEHFQVQGYFATSMQDLMHAAGVTGGALHHHFPTKKALGLAVIGERVLPIVKETWIEPLQTAVPLARAVSAVLTGIARGIDERGRARGCPLNNLAQELALGDPDFSNALGAVFDEWRTALGARIAATKGGRRLSPAQRTAAASFIVSAYSGAMAQAKVVQHSAPLRAAAVELSRWLHERSFVPMARRAARVTPR